MSPEKSLPAFKAYDIRGKVPDQLDPAMACQIGRAFVDLVKPKSVVVGHDVRLTSEEIARALIDGINAGGADTIEIGLCGTEEVYYATAHLEADGGVMVTASHNPRDYNGMKLVRGGSRPISADTGLKQIEATVLAGGLADAPSAGTSSERSVRRSYIEHLLGHVDRAALKPLKIVVNAGNGCAGPVLDLLDEHLPFELVRLHHEPDGSFPNGVPNPMLVENRAVTSDAVREHGADLGVAWDGDFDRCFLFDAGGEFIEGYYIVGLLAEQILARAPGGKIIYDPRLTWNTIDIVSASGGEPVLCKSGHAFIKEKMRAVDAVYGGEMSAHHYFRRFTYCDSGMIPWLLVAQAVSKKGPLADLLAERMRLYPASGEINRRLPDPLGALTAVKERYAGQGRLDETDGVSVELERWRFNLRMSNTEPLVRLNVEARGDEALMREKTEELLRLLQQLGATE